MGDMWIGPLAIFPQYVDEAFMHKLWSVLANFHINQFI